MSIQLKYITPEMEPQEPLLEITYGMLAAKHFMKMLHELEQWKSQ
ncbi:MAG: hypothetical protein V7677_14985 [Motiliproteus sp.]